MSVKSEVINVTHCDFCGASDKNRILHQCSRCGKDACPDHLRPAQVLGLGPTMVASLCNACQGWGQQHLLPMLGELGFKEKV